MDEIKNPIKNIPRAIYATIILAILSYVIISLDALFAIPTEEIIKHVYS
ncbi:MAG: amino acid transporter [Polaribacter sp.]|jgi:amino acid transporter